MNYFSLLFFLSVITFTNCVTPASLDKSYEKGVKAYSDERWSRCIEKFEESLHLYKLYKSVLINCRQKCNAQRYERQVIEDIGDLKIYETYFNKRNCLKRCQELGFAELNMKSTPDEYVLYKMQAKKPYEYLHICYYQMHMYPKAASAAYTYFVAHPEDEVMKGNLHYYIEQPEVNINEVVDLEGDDYVLLYNLGIKSYNKGNWAETVAYLEEALKAYIASENYCRMECEQQPGQEWSSEFVITISNNMASVLNCHQQCQDKLKYLEYSSGVEFLSDILNHIQMSYYHLEKLEEAAEAVQSFLILKPDHKDMLANVEFYSNLGKEVVSKRPVIEYYVKRDKYEKELLNFFDQKVKDEVESNLILNE